ncbi:MAG: hypothetical protein JNM83_11015 [Myxococcales bacterium]|jgi:hypothetical protein|nr:hypothetical protein [Myxococcales bacterium]
MTHPSIPQLPRVRFAAKVLRPRVLRWSLGLLSIFAPAAFSSAKPPTVGPEAVNQRSYHALEEHARHLADDLGMPADRRDLAMGRLRTAFESGKIAAFSKEATVSGIFAYQMGEGGFLVKVKKGQGLARLSSSEPKVALELKSVTFGAQVGGGSEWGFGVILGLRNATAFGGEYSGDSRGATAGGESINITKLTKKGIGLTDPNYHELYLVGVAKGLSAGAAIGNLTITRK